jgi:ABC-type transporter Mla MlaB component
VIFETRAFNIVKESPMLKITANEDKRTVRLKLEGKLKGSWVPEMERSWRNATPGRNKALIVDLTDVEYVDTAGRYLLALMHAHGASFVADTPLMAQLVAEISAQPEPPH